MLRRSFLHIGCLVHRWVLGTVGKTGCNFGCYMSSENMLFRCGIDFPSAVQPSNPFTMSLLSENLSSGIPAAWNIVSHMLASGVTSGL